VLLARAPGRAIYDLLSAASHELIELPSTRVVHFPTIHMHVRLSACHATPAGLIGTEIKASIGLNCMVSFCGCFPVKVAKTARK